MTTLKLKTNLRCGACVKSIRPLLDAEPGVKRWDADVSNPDKLLTVEGEGITAARVGELLGQKGYEVVGVLPVSVAAPVAVPTKTTYYPLVLILLYLLGAVWLAEAATGGFDGTRAMRHFMAGFFLVFSFFKMLDVPAFAVSYSSYDVVARRWIAYGYLYPFIEMALGAAYLADFKPLLTNVAALVVMGVSAVGVVSNLMDGRRIKCACLGTVFNLPMSYVTLFEDVLMAGMAAAMLVTMLDFK